MSEFDLLVDMHKHMQRQGPGSPRVTKKAIELTGLMGRKNLEIADIGCGTGGQTLSLASKLDVLFNHGYEALEHFILPENCWTDHYYLPLQESYKSFLERQGHSQVAMDLVASDKTESEMYMKYKQYYSYGFYIARKL